MLALICVHPEEIGSRLDALGLVSGSASLFLPSVCANVYAQSASLQIQSVSFLTQQWQVYHFPLGCNLQICKNYCCAFFSLHIFQLLNGGEHKLLNLRSFENNINLSVYLLYRISFCFFFTFSILTFNTKEYSEEVSSFLKNRGEKYVLQSLIILPLIFERKLMAVKQTTALSELQVRLYIPPRDIPCAVILFQRVKAQ